MGVHQIKLVITNLIVVMDFMDLCEKKLKCKNNRRSNSRF